MSQEPSKPSHNSADESGFALQREAFVVRVWRSAADGTWRCRLIHVETGRHLPCDHPGEVGERIEAWLGQVERGKGLR
ncbi:MAG: hypothetical protein KF893_07030 [Caldilineaceae bacterium]|nr:hypothetical protein [Caldilineaceae bacterium]